MLEGMRERKAELPQGGIRIEGYPEVR